jgi:hypothetical protein
LQQCLLQRNRAAPILDVYPGRNLRRESGPSQEILAMFSSFVQRTRDSIQKRRRYNRLVAEIESLSDRDFADLNSSRGEMLYQIRRDIYGR